MNCANHPGTMAAAYCQYCGKPLCAECMRRVNGIVSCEPCLAPRIHPSGIPASDTSGFPPPGFQPQPWGREPWIAFVLGLIPGVGAMYNGQIAKGLAHVVIFAILVDLSNWNGAFGILIAAWIFYQAFEAYHTAAARRDGRPLPNPLGLNDIGRWFGRGNFGPPLGVHPGAQSDPTAATPANPPSPSAGYADVPPASNFGPPYAPPPIPPIPPPPGGHGPWSCGGGLPTAAVVLVVLGVLFLLGNFGILSPHWIDRGWPILLILLGVWMVFRHKNTPPPAGGMQ